MMSVVGLPHTSRRRRIERIQPYESSIESARSVIIGTTPFKSGMPKSCIGTAARSEMSMVSTSSVGSSSPICLFPISRRPSMMIKYKRIVRTKAVAMIKPPGGSFDITLPREGTFYCFRPSYPDGGDKYQKKHRQRKEISDKNRQSAMSLPMRRTTRREVIESSADASPCGSGAHTVDKYAGDRGTKGL